MLVDFTAEGCPVIQRTLVDITMRKELQLQLNREQELYRAAMEAGSSITYEYLMEEDLFISHSLQFGSDITRQKVPHYSKATETVACEEYEDPQILLIE